LLSALHDEIEAASAKPPVAAVEAVEEISAEDIPAPEEEVALVPEPKSGVLDALVSDLESSLGDGFLPEAAAHEVAPEPEPEPQATEPTAASAAAHHPVRHPEPQSEPQPAGKLSSFVSDLEASLGDSFLAEAPVAKAEPPSKQRVIRDPEPEVASAKAQMPIPVKSAPAQVPAAMAAAAATQSVTTQAVRTPPGAAQEPASAPPTFTYHPSTVRTSPTHAPGATPPKFDSGPGVDLADMFGELKHELEEDSNATDEDPETHYNLGVAFREMGLLDEAIGELQKVCQAVDRGHPFPHIMQTYTWLSQCFLDKGIPEAAIRWYEQALKLTTIDADTRTALHYELASSYEIAGDKASALSHFMQVYGSNIDYRDVAERIKTLKS